MSSANDDVAVVQPEGFEFTAENLEKAKAVIAKYPAGRAASGVIPLLYIVQDQARWVPRAAMDYVAGLLGMPPIRVYEVATFYTMFNLKPVGTWQLQVCTTTPCWLAGSDAVMEACKRKLGIDLGGTTADAKFSLMEVECLGACVNAPVVQINNGDLYEDLDGPRTEALLDSLARGEAPPKGSTTGRQTSAPAGGPTTLMSLRLDGGGDAA